MKIVETELTNFRLYFKDYLLYLYNLEARLN
jgi:hypothetical protein